MGTEARLVFYAPDSATAHAAARAAFDRLAELDSLLSHFRDDSEVAALARASGDPRPVSEDLWTVLVVAHDFALGTDGVFDVTHGRWRELVLDRATRRVTPGIPLDLGAIGKGYGADEALATLRRFGITSALIAFGGELVAGDGPPGTDGWVVQVGDTTTTLTNGAISTSGLGLAAGQSVSVRASSGLLADPLATATALLRASASARDPLSP
ncbi:MAG: FAD:protein FMN transferase [Gemmatimonadales bacterium]